MTHAFPRRPVLLLIAAALAGAGLAACSKPKEAKPAEAPLTVSVGRIETRSLNTGMAASGLLVSREEAGVAADLSGYRVADVLFEEGAVVAKGQPLAHLDDTLLRAQIDQSKANVAQAQVAADKADAEAGRVKGLDNEGVLSQEAIDQRRLAARSAHASLDVAKAQLRDLQTRQEHMVIRAPVAGRILERTVRPGDTSSTSTNMFRIARGGLVELDAEIPEAQLARIDVGDRAEVTLPSGEKVPGVVRLISPRVDQATKLGRARIALPVRPDLRPGGFGQAAFTGTTATVTAAPESAVRFDADGASVMVVGADSRVHRAAVKTGARQGGWVELVSGPPAGSRVALGGSAFILEGDKVQVRDAGSAAR